MSRRRAFTLVELLVVMAILAVLTGLIVGGLVRAREVAGRVACANNLRQIGLALNGYQIDRGSLPPGMVCTAGSVLDASSTGFTCLLPYLEENAAAQKYQFDQPWYDMSNADAVGIEVKTFFCPSNRTSGSINLTAIGSQWGGASMPPKAAACDYALCKGANGSLARDSSKSPLAVRGVFGIVPDGDTPGVRLEDISDGTSHTIAVGDAAGGCARFPVRNMQSGQPTTDPTTGKIALMEQSWSAAGTSDAGHPYYASAFAVTAQTGFGGDPRDEPMNRRPGTPTISGGGSSNYTNRSGKDMVSGFRSVHARGCNFLFCDGSVRYLSETIQPAVYRALSTFAGGETVGDGY